MMRLIDADKFIEYMESNCDYDAELDPYIFAICKGGVNNQPTAFDVNKVVEQLEEYPHGDYVNVETIGDIIEIVKKGGQE